MVSPNAVDVFKVDVLGCVFGSPYIDGMAANAVYSTIFPTRVSSSPSNNYAVAKEFLIAFFPHSS
jgi:hypothetical protein